MISRRWPRPGVSQARCARCGRRRVASAAQRARDAVRPGRPGRCERRGDPARKPPWHACEERRADRGAARGVAFARRPHAVRGHCVRGGRSSHAHRGPAASAAAFARRPPLARPARRHRRAAARPSTPFHPAVRGRSGRRPGRPRAPWAADPVCARPQAARSLGRLDANRRRSGRVRAALGRLCAGLAHTCGLAAPRRRFRHAHPCRRRDRGDGAVLPQRVPAEGAGRRLALDPGAGVRPAGRIWSPSTSAPPELSTGSAGGPPPALRHWQP